MTRSPNLSRSVADALKDAQFMTRDGATVALAKTYAALIDDADDPVTVANDLGPKLLAALTALGMTPQARAAASKGVTPDAVTPAAASLSRLRDAAAG